MELEAATSFSKSATEVTLECNPESLDQAKAELMLEHGVKRLSIGFQSLEPETLQLFGRVHDVETSMRAFESARRAGVEDLNIDMIYAAPGHNTDAWRTALQTVLELQTEHISAYNLAFEEDTVFSRWLRDGKLQSLPEEIELEMFHVTRELTSQAGLDAYEISNYAKPGHECKHNQNYWDNGSYLGIGPSAVSYVGGRRSGNAKGIESYIASIRNTGHANKWTEVLSPRARLGETWWLGLRQAAGVLPEAARCASAFDAEEDPAVETAKVLVSQGLLQLVGDRFVLTKTGTPLADRVAAEFLWVEDSD